MYFWRVEALKESETKDAVEELELYNLFLITPLICIYIK